MNKSIASLFSIVLLAILIMVGKGCYKNEINKEVVQDLKIQTNIIEGEAIDKANEITVNTNKLSDDAIHKRLLRDGDYRAEDRSASQSNKRVPSLYDAPIITPRPPSIQAPSGHAQRPVPFAMPRCKIRYGFDEQGNIAEFKTCEDE